MFFFSLCDIFNTFLCNFYGKRLPKNGEKQTLSLRRYNGLDYYVYQMVNFEHKINKCYNALMEMHISPMLIIIVIIYT